jgi:mono/diheme cytochrome c family protein
LQQKILISLVLTLIIVIFIPLYWATESGRQEAAQERMQTEAIGRGVETYISICATCHGSEGEGKIGPALKDTHLDEDTLEKIIARGLPGTTMLAWGEEDDGPLKSHQIKDLVTFIKNWDSALSPTPASPPPTPAPTPTPTPPPTPTAINATELYATSCAGCHGANRQGVSGLGPALTPDSLVALSDAEVTEIILNGRSGTAMAAFGGTLTLEKIDALLQLIKYVSP